MDSRELVDAKPASHGVSEVTYASSRAVGPTALQDGRRVSCDAENQSRTKNIALIEATADAGLLRIPSPQESLSADMRRCYELLQETSRSFAAVIQALDDELR